MGHRIESLHWFRFYVYGNEIQYTTAIVFVRKGKGAFTFIRKQKEFQKISIKERMLNEVNKSVEIAFIEFFEILEKI